MKINHKYCVAKFSQKKIKLNAKVILTVFILNLLFLSVSSQTLELPIIKANTQMFNGNVYVFGICDQNKKSKLSVYKIDFKLNITDSLIIDLGKNTSEDYLQITSDTLHGFLNIYIQKKEKKLVNIYRFNKLFERIALIEDIDIARLNSISAFENEIFYYKSDVYTIKSVNDTSGKQFYLNKYSLKSELKNFEYDNKWQFPFERKNINSAHITFADNRYIFIYVNIINGNKRGQWLLKINALTGLLLRGIKINEKGDNSFYSFGQLTIDSLSKNVFLQGQKYSEADFDQKQNKNNLSNKLNLNIFIVEIDSIGDLLLKNEFKIAIAEAKGVVNKTPVNYIIRTNKILKSKEGDFLIETDIYKGSNNEFCYNYCNSIALKLSRKEDNYILEKNASSPITIGTNQLIEKYYLNNDKTDMTGKICVDSLGDFEKLFYYVPTFNVKIAHKFDDNNNPFWLLKKADTKKNIQNYSVLSPVKKIYQLTLLQEINKSESPVLIYLSKNQFIISKQSFPDKFQLQLYNW